MGIPKKNKYKARKTEVDGIVFHSAKEAMRYMELRIRQRAGEIQGLELQPKWPIVIEGVKVCTVIGDFAYYDLREKRRIVEDVKGMDTPVSKLKRKLLLAIHGVDMVVIQSKRRAA